MLLCVIGHIVLNHIDILQSQPYNSVLKKSLKVLCLKLIILPKKYPYLKRETYFYQIVFFNPIPLKLRESCWHDLP